MSTVHRISTVMPEAGARMEPGIRSEGRPSRDPVKMRDAVYRAMQLALEQYERPETTDQRAASLLAEDMGAARSDTFARIMRKEDSKGNLLRAYLDFLGWIFTQPKSAMTFMAECSRLLELEPPVPMKKAAAEDIGIAWLRQLASLPPGEREGRIADMAVALGVTAEAIKTMAGIR